MVPARNILVATNFSDSAAAALEYAKALAGDSGAKLHVLHAVDDLTTDAPMLTAVDLDGILAQAEGESLDRLRSLLSDEERARMHVEFHVVRQGPYDAILEFARKNRIDLIVLGSSSRGAIAQFIMGSVSDAIVRNAPCPVLSVKADSLVAA